MSNETTSRSILQSAVACHQEGRLHEAQALYKELLVVNPRDADALHLLGVTLFQQGLLNEALVQIAESLQINPENCLAYTNIGNIFQQLGRFQDAINCYDCALAVDPKHADACFNRGIALQALNRDIDALRSYEETIVLKPGYTEAYFNSGNSLHSLGRFDDALGSYDKALVLRPRYAEAYNNRGNSLFKLGRSLEAVSSYDNAIGIDREYAQAFFNRGVALQRLEENEDAVSSYSDAIRIKPDYAEALNNRGNTLQCLDLYQDALASYRGAQEIDDTYGDAHWNEALCQLKTGDFENGWENYEWRLHDSISNPEKRIFLQPAWSGNEELNGRKILLHAEQGFGDTIQFCRYAKMVAALGADVTLEVHSSLAGLMKELDGGTKVSSVYDVEKYDFHCPLLSLPLAFGTRLATIPARTSYLTSDPLLDAYWSSRCGAKQLPRVGIVWEGNKNNRNDTRRSAPLSNIAGMLRSDIQWFCLQKEICRETGDFLDLHGVRHFEEELTTFSDTAALIDQMDAVISVDTAVAHLAAALGKPTWILLSHNADFRWLLGRRDSPWYPTARLFRQPVTGDWSGLFHTLNKHVTRSVDDFASAGCM
jgi:tetratricopeptide (TPR) repeat protein